MKQYNKWKRMSEIYDDAQIFHGGITPSDLNQGALGDCYYLAVLSAMAEIPERVEACFHTKERNSAGIYLMSFFINGVVSPVIVDDHVPTIYDRPSFVSTKDGEMWAMLLDKAWAKLQGTYARVESG